jgi:hypothetical protein
VPWRVALDYQWNREARAYEYLKSFEFLADQYVKNGYKLPSSYTHDGKVIEQFESPTMYSTVLAYFSVMKPDLAKKVYQEKLKLPYQVVPFIENMVEAYSKASLVICRSGALTVSELIQIGRPSLLIPFPRKGQNDQTANAYYLERHGVAKVVEQGPDFESRFWNTFVSIFETSQLEKMRAGFSALRTGNALDTIGDQVESVLG